MTIFDVLLSRVSMSSLQAPAPECRDLELILASGLRARSWRPSPMAICAYPGGSAGGACRLDH